ncbi:ABC transporter permease [Dictyobacter alpinus]|uniref:ABC transporter permease n=1 Tax=Dictyobacter alpinus TaxID=2014873 RepID=A0A402BEH7_9CHLR|nr:sugar ABC transporter permease [Dictyobacter alpinus]GCE29700.1 ABC transporter permease [Dictyobacter alpinus]
MKEHAKAAIIGPSTDQTAQAGVQRAQPLAGRSAKKTQSGSNILLILTYLFLIAMGIFAVFPLYYTVQASLAGGQNLYTTDLHLLPAQPTLDNYGYVFTQLPIFNWIGNTVLVAGLTTILGVIFSTSGAYAISRFRFTGRQLSLRGLLALQAFPGLLALPAYYILLNALGLVDNLLGLVLIYAAGSLVFCCWNTKTYFDTLPIELEWAAMLDGANHFQAFWSIILPLALPALVVSALFSFLGGWSEFALANLVLNSNGTGSNLTFILGLYSLQSNFNTPWGIFAAASVVISVPLMILFLYAQRFFRSGLTLGSLSN